MKLNENDLKELSRRIDDYHATRDHANPEELRILVDGREYCSLKTSRMKRVDLGLDDEADMIEVRTSPEEGNVLLATWYIDYPSLLSNSGPVEYTTMLKSGQKISFEVSPEGTSPDETFCFNLGIVYRETSLLRAARLEWRRIMHRLESVSPLPALKQAFSMRYALPALLAVLTIGGVRLYIDYDSDPGESMIALNKESRKDISPALPATTPNPEVSPQKSQVPKQPARAAVKPDGWSGIPERDIVTRSAESESPAILSGIRSILVKLPEPSPEGAELAATIKAELLASGYWRIASEDEADAALVLRIDTEKKNVSVSLIDENGNTIWPVGGVEQRLYSGSWGELAKRIVADLTSDATGR
ncbi:MAG: hypothetical protein IPM66_05880 [Acidobacteriota bacterium]|nr:MAG: hypothetical protein IPM66_05880 [Acidobacteriota bacterium]